MTHCFPGGTNFGFMNGANAIKGEFKYQPTVTSYGKSSNNLTIQPITYCTLVSQLPPRKPPPPLPA